MKKRAVFALLLLLAAVAGAWTAGVKLHAAADQVTLTRRELYGRADAARGLTLTLHSAYRNRLLWTTTADAQGALETQFTAFPAQAWAEEAVSSYSGLEMYTMLDQGMDPSDGVTLPGLDSALEELSAATPNGQEAEKTIYLRDYLDYYPLTLQLELPGYWQMLDDILRRYDQLSPQEQQTARDLIDLGKYFKIPVLEEERCTLSLGKSEDGRAWHWGTGSAEGDSYSMWTVSAVTSEACYFTFTTLTQEGKVVDTGELSLGYGVYRLPYELDEFGVARPLVEDLELVYPLEPGVQILNLQASPDESRLLLHTGEGGRYLLTVVDPAARSSVQILDAAPYDPDSGWRLYSQGDFLAAVLEGDTLAVITLEPDGSCELAHLWDAWPPEREDLAFSAWDLALDYDGERLALAGILDDGEARLWDTCNYFLAVYQGEGLAYYGEYRNSLYTAGQDLESYEYACRSRYATPLGLAWAENP